MPDGILRLTLIQCNSSNRFVNLLITVRTLLAEYHLTPDLCLSPLSTAVSGVHTLTELIIDWQPGEILGYMLLSKLSPVLFSSHPLFPSHSLFVISGLLMLSSQYKYYKKLFKVWKPYQNVFVNVFVNKQGLCSSWFAIFSVSVVCIKIMCLSMACFQGNNKKPFPYIFFFVSFSYSGSLDNYMCFILILVSRSYSLYSCLVQA